MIRDIDKLDLLGVRYDAEMEMKAKYDVAKEVYNSWKNKSEKEQEEWEYDVYEYCIINISEKIGYNYDDIVKDEVYEIWEIIENEFLKGE